MALINTALSLWDTISAGMADVYEILVQPLSELLSLDIPIVGTVIDFIVDNLGIGEYTVLDVMFGVGIPFVIIFAITKWVIDILP